MATMMTSLQSSFTSLSISSNSSFLGQRLLSPISLSAASPVTPVFEILVLIKDIATRILFISLLGFAMHLSFQKNGLAFLMLSRPAVGGGSLITLLFFWNSLQVKPTGNPCLVFAKLKRWERKKCKPNSLPILHKMHVKFGDTVKVISGRDTGKIGEVTKIFTHNSTIVIKDVNLKTKHMKSREEGEPGQILKSSFTSLSISSNSSFLGQRLLSPISLSAASPVTPVFEILVLIKDIAPFSSNMYPCNGFDIFHWTCGLVELCLSLYLASRCILAFGGGSLITLLFFWNSLQVKPTGNPCLVFAKLKRWERKKCKPNSLPILHKMHVKFGDTVKVISGRDKGKIGEVTKIFTHNSTIVIKDVNLKTKHMKSREEGEPGQILKVSQSMRHT
ncbi:hypothetical protein F2Q70_00014984 [Brassica cretica]|uniref:KOW domain-containing protein n=1 Tax=Brassica cretica TaxID=69181 RepID=A0A8S9HWI0_BRACR|nr:hypothetical protein F2Q70_00014984 [Brassica cretica]